MRKNHYPVYKPNIAKRIYLKFRRIYDALIEKRIEDFTKGKIKDPIFVMRVNNLERKMLRLRDQCGLNYDGQTSTCEECGKVFPATQQSKKAVHRQKRRGAKGTGSEYRKHRIVDFSCCEEHKHLDSFIYVIHPLITKEQQENIYA